MSDRIVLYPFHLRDALTGKWYRARWVASKKDIERLGRIVDGEPEIRERTDWGNGFAPYRELREPVDSVELRPGFDAFERGLTRVFLRRYVTWCTRR